MNHGIEHVVKNHIQLMILHACSNKLDNFNIFPVETIEKSLQIYLFQISIE